MFEVFFLSKTSHLHIRSKTVGPCESVVCTFYGSLGGALSVDVREMSWLCRGCRRELGCVTGCLMSYLEWQVWEFVF